MKLNPDCVRDILMECEEKCTITKGIKFPCNQIFIRDGRCYSSEETSYHLRQCELNGYFFRASKDLDRNFYVSDLSPKAHEFLANIRSNDNWEKTKKIASGIGSVSLSTLSSVASNVISAAVKAYFGV